MRFKKVSIYVFSLFIILNILIIFSSIKQKEHLGNFFRIHVVANSNSREDQELKYLVAENLQKYINDIYKANNITSKEDAKELIVSNIHKLLNMVNQSIKDKNFNYSVYADIGNIKYDRKENKYIQMAKGTYDSVRFVIGEGKGKNFWSLLFPYSLSDTYEIDIYNEDYSKDNITINDMLENANTTYSSFLYEWFINTFKD